jgi:putative DNA-invertase from lambdoid prophage Rac
VKVLAAVADFERGLIVERTQAGLARAKAQGTKLGRPSKTDPKQRQEIRQRLADGASVSQVARDHGLSRASVIGIRDASA